ncbi:ABC transporter ATP-binding protein [Anaerococcus sp. AGMB00486]|uniref:ABC transporter ATP-binding protein n=2 Tax=Anaerococcus TaxID=165779 RepID=A0ABX2N865_9FIRM|nr:MULTISPECIES: ABC transporter ATP-binding protein [Anaerococcus]MSS77343.1 ABC transporter ATP-binding protein [Anaerococcus porci]NVF10855.1 ABC transporter ATP-binding protein [Anaerococcus faecalis]
MSNKLNSSRNQNSFNGGIVRLLKYLFNYKWQMIVVIISVIISTLTQILGMSLLQPTIDEMILNSNIDGLKKNVLMMVGLFIISAITSLIFSRLMVRVSEKAIKDIRNELFEKIQSLELEFFDQNTHGEIMSRFTNDTDMLGQSLSSSIPNLLQSLLLFIGTFAIMFVINFKLTILTLLTIGLMLFILKKIITKSTRLFSRNQVELGKMNGFIEETLSGQKVVKVFNFEENLKDRFNKTADRVRELIWQANTITGKIMPFLKNGINISYAIICMVGAVLTILGQMTVGTLATYLTYVRQLQNPIATVSQQANVMAQAIAGANRIFEILDMEAESDDGDIDLVHATIDKDGNFHEENTLTGIYAWKRIVNGEIKYKRLEGKIDFEHVDFSYDGKNKILKDVTFYANPGEKIAFVGSTGAGKTTITNVITRFYDIDKGSIKVDDIDIYQIKKSALRKAFGMVLQDVSLFTDTIYENIRYGRLDANDDEIKAAARMSKADSFICRLPHGYDTKIHGNGSSLSDGQNQLVSISRAAVDEPSMLILDEATSSIDSATELIVTDAMDNLMTGSTSIVIAHRLSTIKNSDVIMVMDNGRIIERGNHDSLMAKKGTYYQLYTGKLELD